MFVEEKAKGEVPDFKLGTIRLSTAIRIGSKLRPQCTGRLFRGGASCALGAAAEALGMPYQEGADFNPVPNHIWDVFRAVPKMEEIYARNDSGKYTREQIADWLESEGY